MNDADIVREALAAPCLRTTFPQLREDALAALDRLVADPTFRAAAKAIQDAEARAEAAEAERDALQMTHDEGEEIIGEIVRQIETVSPAPADIPCKCIHCRHSRGVTRLIDRLEAAEAERDRLRAALRDLFDYTLSLEQLSGGLLISRGITFPEGGAAIGDRVRAALGGKP